MVRSSGVGIELEIVGTIGRRPGRRVLKCTGVSFDSRTLRPGEVFFALGGARCDGHGFVRQALEKGAAAAVICRDVAVPPEFKGRLVRVADSLRALGDAARLYRRKWGGLVIAVTGSNGKTTTREMIHYIVSDKIPCTRSPKSFNTDIGVPLTLFAAKRTDKVIVVEMGTNAPGEIAALGAIAEPNVGVITNIGATHLAGLGSIQGVAQAKAELFDALRLPGTAVLNADDAMFNFLSHRYAGKVISYGLSPDADFRATDVQRLSGGCVFHVQGGRPVRLRVPGLHNVRNALAALAVAAHLGMDLSAAAERLSTFRLPPMRYEVEVIHHVTVVNDCYNANPDSMQAALETFGRTAPRAGGRRVVVLGDMMELGDHSERFHRRLGVDVARAGVDALFAVGKFADCVARSAREKGLTGRVFHAPELDGVAQSVRKFLRPGDALLVKGSRGMKLERLVEELRDKDGRMKAEGGRMNAEG